MIEGMLIQETLVQRIQWVTVNKRENTKSDLKTTAKELRSSVQLLLIAATMLLAFQIDKKN